MMMSQRWWNSDQSWRYEAVHCVAERMVRITICRNSYNFQSYLKADLFDGNKWNNLVIWPIGGFEKVSYTKKTLTEEDKKPFIAAEQELLDHVFMILKGKIV